MPCSGQLLAIESIKLNKTWSWSQAALRFVNGQGGWGVSTNQCIRNQNTARWVLQVSPGSSEEECLRIEELKSVHHLLLYMMYYIMFFELREAGAKRIKW